ncbi:hypothetical protein [Streptomyces sp. NPDC049879]|uniref:hypothetical protein n=1 Tax=Streptomyces sp. NPDC049879 TaxID=3365598 RepID=UPI00378B568F
MRTDAPARAGLAAAADEYDAAALVADRAANDRHLATEDRLSAARLALHHRSAATKLRAESRATD